ncbi:hypothetical protein ACHAW6_003437 [Cyclotella cf. meneghiniana]
MLPAVSSRFVAIQRHATPCHTRFRRIGIYSSFLISPLTPRTFLPCKRTYIFLPSTTNDMIKFLKSNLWLRPPNPPAMGKIRVKLSARWHDRLSSLLDRYDELSSSSSRRTRSPNYLRVQRGMKRLLTHYNAKKRVFLAARGAFGRMDAEALRETSHDARRRGELRLSRWKNRWRKKREEWAEWFFRNAGGTREEKEESATWKSLVLSEPTKASWFDAEGYPLTSREEETGRFVNPWLSQSSNGENGLKKFLRWKLGSFKKRWGWDAVAEEDGSTRRTEAAKSPFREGTWPYASAGDFTNFSKRQQNIRLAWLGHSTTLVAFPGKFTILTDPHFSNYAGPMRRNDPPPVSVMELPPLDCVLISHDHMDHLDYWSILELIEANKVKFWIVPLGIKEWLVDKAGVAPEDIVQLEWWEGVRISKEGGESEGHASSFSNPHVVTPVVEEIVLPFDKSHRQEANQRQKIQSGKSDMIITCAPAQHWCSRTPFDRNRRLWCSWAVRATPSPSYDTRRTSNPPPTHSFYFAGDTGLPPEFPLHHQIGDRLGPFDLAAIPIGAYEPRWFMRESHCDPAEAVMIHQAIRSRRSVAIHFDTFNLADEPQAEPPQLLAEEVERVNREIGRLAVEVAAVAGEVGVVMEMESSVATMTLNGEMTRNVDSSSGEETCLAEPHEPLVATQKLLEMLPPLVDFAVIPQGHCIESSPK